MFHIRIIINKFLYSAISSYKLLIRALAALSPETYRQFFFFFTIITQGKESKETTIKHNILKQEIYSNEVLLK